MEFIDDWKVTLRKAWSFRLMALSGAFTTAEVILPLYSDAFPRGVFAALSGVSVFGGMVMRFVAQKDMK